MRILFTFAGGSGHAEPLIPIAAAAQAAGHTVAFAGRTSVAATIEARGFTAFGDASGIGEPRTERSPLLELDAEREDLVLRYGFADRIARARAARVLSLCAQWDPDLIVCDEVDFGSVVAAERFGIPHATVLVIAAGSFVRRHLVVEPLNVLRAEYELLPDPELDMLSRYLVLSPFPPSFRDPAFPLPDTAHSLRPGVVDAAADAPAWLTDRRRDVPLIYFTLGTIFNIESGDLFTRVLSGLRALEADVVVTVGRQIDPTELGPQPEHVRVERFVPQSTVLPHCDLVVHHGGSGSVLGALAHGLPSVVLPLGADQPLNAGRCAALGLGHTLDAIRVTPELVQATVSEVLADPSHRTAARRMQAELDALPGPESAVPLLERCGRG